MAGKAGAKWQIRKFKALMEHALEKDDVQKAVCDRIKKIASNPADDKDFIALLGVYTRLTQGEMTVILKPMVRLDE